MAHRKSDSGMSNGVPLRGMRDVHVPSNPVAGTALTITQEGEFGILDYSQDYFTAKALEVIPPMGAVKMGPGGVLPKTSAAEPASPVIGVSVEGSAAGDDAVILRSGKIAGKVFSPVNSVLRTLDGGTIGVGASGTVVGTVDAAGAGYVSIGSASSGGGSASVSAASGNIISEKQDGLFAAVKLSNKADNALSTEDDGIYVSLGERYLQPGDVYVADKATVHPNLIPMSSYNVLKKADYPELLGATGNWWYKYLQEEAKVTLPYMMANSLPAPMVVTASSVSSAAERAPWKVFSSLNGTNDHWSSNQGSKGSWIELDTGDVYASIGCTLQARQLTATNMPPTARIDLYGADGTTVVKASALSLATGSMASTDAQFVPGTRTDKDATIGVVRGVRKIRLTDTSAQTTTCVGKIVPELYIDDMVPDMTTEFVTQKRVHEVASMEYFLVAKTIKVNSDGSFSDGIKEVTISPDSGNSAEMRPNGLFVEDGGESAYELAVRLGFQGTESEWLFSLQGRDRNGVADDDANLALIRETRAGEIIYWPSSIIPILLDGLPKGLPVSGGIASLVTYPRLDRVLCSPEHNSWAPAWFRCDDDGTRNASGLFIQLDDWRGGYPQIMDNGRNSISNYLVVNITAGSNKLVLVNNMSFGTLLTPSKSLEGIYPGMRLEAANLVVGTTIVSVDSTGIYIDKPAITAGASVWVTSYGRMLGGWQGDTGRRLSSAIHIPMNNSGCWITVYEPRYVNYYLSASATGTGYIGGMDTARVSPTSPEYRPKGPVTNAIILV